MEDLEKLQQEVESLNKTIEKLQEKNQETFRKNCDLETRNKKLSANILALQIENIAELKATKILFKMVSKGYTHRQKNDIAGYANIILQTDIDDKINEIRIPENDNPF